MKRLIAFFICVITVLSLAACSDNQVSDKKAAAYGTEASSSLPVINAEQIKDGEYEIEVESSSSMFRIVKCVLTVAEGKMTAAMTMSGQGYGALFMGKMGDAPASPDDTCIPFENDADGAKVFTVPVEALNKPIDCAAWSIRKESWYDRELIFKSDMIPSECISANN